MGSRGFAQLEYPASSPAKIKKIGSDVDSPKVGQHSGRRCTPILRRQPLLLNQCIFPKGFFAWGPIDGPAIEGSLQILGFELYA